ncbi:MAG TPA: hypothetical protein DEO37_06105 [Aerococcaceae bacterium]|nr:hypothetical protein [Aerococcaceae bacterium]
MDRKNIQMIEYRRKINDNLFLSVIISFKRLSAGPIFRDASGENIKKNDLLFIRHFSEEDLNRYLDELEALDFFNWPSHQYSDLDSVSDILNFIVLDGSVNYIFGMPLQTEKMVAAHKATEKLLQMSIGSETDFSDFDIISDYNELSFLTFNVEGTKNEYYDITIDMNHNVYHLEVSDSFGRLVAENKTGSLRTSTIKKLRKKLLKLDLLSWPIETEKVDMINPSKPFIQYSFEVFEFITFGDPTEPNHLAEVHKAIELLISQPFGS